MALIIGGVAIIIATMCATVVWAFRASFRVLNSPTWWFAMAFLLLAVSIILRALYWDVALPLGRLYAPETAAIWSDITKGRMVNLLFSVLKISAFFCALKSRQMMIPEEERHLWPWWRAWMHPNPIRLLPWNWVR